MNNLKIKKGLKTLILLGISFALIPSSIGCKKNQSKELEVVEVIEQPTVSPALEPTLIPTMEPTMQATEVPTISPTLEPTIEPTEKPKKYQKDLTDEEFYELEQQISNLYDSFNDDIFVPFYFDQFNITKEDLINYPYIFAGKNLKYNDASFNDFAPAANGMIDLIWGVNMSLIDCDFYTRSDWERYYIISNMFLKDTEEYKFIRNMELGFQEACFSSDNNQLIDYFLKYADITNGLNDEVDITPFSKVGIVSTYLLLAGQVRSVSEKLKSIDIDLEYAENKDVSLYNQLEDYFVSGSIETSNEIYYELVLGK